jgi:Zn-dependent peptidase ImmA (M78 family)
VTIKDDAAKAAKRLLDETWNGGLPVDPVKIARVLGIDVVNAQLDPNMSGALLKEPGRDPTIFLNAQDSRNRQRFSCAHEIGHFVKRKDNPDQYEYVDFRGQLAGLGVDPDERFANGFAAYLLMPEKNVRELQKQGLDETAMALRFGVSQDAMHNHLKNLKLI